MFKECSNITKITNMLPAKELTDYCYSQMFYNCIKLQYLSVNFVAWHNSATRNWMYGISGVGMFVKNQKTLMIKRGISYIPTSWEIEG
jgi:hypothetical protein